MTQDCSEEPAMVDTAPPVNVRIEPAMSVNHLIGASSGAPNDGYAAACALAQVWSDLLLVAEGSGQSLSVRRRARAGAARAARAAFDIARGRVPRTARSARVGIALEGGLGPWLEILERAVTVPMPECYGYDLGDTEVCTDDAVRFAREQAHGQPMVVVGIRGGGAFLAPRWAAGLARESGVSPLWTTVRPLRTHSQRIGYHSVELDLVRKACQALPDRPDIVIVDDQPDTGTTVKLLAQTLAPLASRLWFACIGKVHQLHANGDWSLALVRSPLRARIKPPLWQLLLQEDHPRFLNTLITVLPQVASGASELRVRCPTLEGRYGRENAWLPWNHPALHQYERRLINPRKTPLIVTDADGRPLLHLRFIGEGAFGLAEFTRVQSFSMPTSRAWFLDGYRIVPHLPDLRPLRDVLANSSREDAKAWLAKSMAILRATESPPIATVSGCAGDTQVGEHICQTLQNLQTRIGGLFPEPPVWLPNLSAPMFSGSRKTIRSALSHAFGYWHWQVGANGTLHRFHLEANWGGLSWPELEIAAFLLEHRLGPEVLAAMIVSGVVESTQEKAVIASLPAATQLWLQGCLRELRQLTPTGAALWREDLFSLWAVLSQYSDLLKYHGISV